MRSSRLSFVLLLAPNEVIKGNDYFGTNGNCPLNGLGNNENALFCDRKGSFHSIGLFIYLIIQAKQ